MSKELEALDRLFNSNLNNYEYRKEYDLIETALKVYEKIKLEYSEIKIYHYDLLKENERLHNQKAKKLKAFEIIKDKRVNADWLLETENVEEYNESLYNDLTQEEFDLLKEVLLWD